MESTILRSVSKMSSLRRPLNRPMVLCARCLLHTTANHSATPVTHPAFAGPPPQPPQASATHPSDRIARKKLQADLLRQGQTARVDPAKPESALSKRFWKSVSVREDEQGALQILLDTRPVRTASKHPLTLPKRKRALAAAIALEWDALVSAQQALKQHYVPLTSLTARALDIERGDDEGEAGGRAIREPLAKMLLRYLATDTLLCWAPAHNPHESLQPPHQAPSEKSLRQQQREAAEPIIAYLTTHIFPGVEIVPVLSEDSIIPAAQPALTLDVIRGWISGLPAFELAALERAVLATKSFLIGARLVVAWSAEWEATREEGSSVFGIEEAERAATLEVMYQTEQWGEVEDTHDVEKEDMRRQLGSAILLVS